MKKLKKREKISKNTIQAYALGCNCTCVCYCTQIGSFNLYSSRWSSPHSDISIMPKIG